MRKLRCGLPWQRGIQPCSTPTLVLLLCSTRSQPLQLFYQHKYLMQHSADTWHEEFLFSWVELSEPQHVPRNGKNIHSHAETECGISSKISVVRSFCSSAIIKYIPEKVFWVFFSCSQSLVGSHTVFPEQQMYMVRLLCYLRPVALAGHQLWERLWKSLLYMHAALKSF